MRTAILSACLLAASLSLAACGGPEVGAVVVSGDVEVRSAEGASSDAGPVPFGNGAKLVAETPSVVRVSCGGRLHAGSTAEGRPDPGLVDVHLDEGAELKRREGAAFDLLVGAVRLDAGPVTSRIVVFRGTTFLEIPTTNGRGVDLRASVDGRALTVEVTRGEVLLHSTGATEKELHYVTLGPGERATASPGSEPVKGE